MPPAYQGNLMRCSRDFGTILAHVVLAEIELRREVGHCDGFWVVQRERLDASEREVLGCGSHMSKRRAGGQKDETGICKHKTHVARTDLDADPVTARQQNITRLWTQNAQDGQARE